MTAATTTPAVRSPRHARLSGAIAAEWTKAWSVRSTWYCLFAGVVLAVIQARLVECVVRQRPDRRARHRR